MRLVDLLASLVGSVCLTLNNPAATPRLSAGKTGQDLEGHRWLLENYPRAVDFLLPRGTIPTGEFPHDTQWIATTRILPPSGKPEYRLALRKKYNGIVMASAVFPRDSSIDDQLKRLRKQHPDATLTEILHLVQLQKVEFDSRSEPQLTKLARAFEEIQISPVLPDVAIIHPVTYEFWAESLYGARMEVQMAGGWPEVAEQGHPLLGWAQQFLKLVREQSGETKRGKRQ